MADNVICVQKRANEEVLDSNDCINDECSVNSSIPPSKKQRDSSFDDYHQLVLGSKIDEIRREENKQKFFLVLTNLPGKWTCEHVMNYVKEECGVSISNIKDSRDSLNDFQIKLKFETEEHRSEVLDKLKIQETEGNLCVEIKDDDFDGNPCSESTALIEEREITEVHSPENNDAWEPGPDGVFGLKETYLETLGITSPLSNWVTVTNFRCDKSELKEVLELAGHVLICSVNAVSSKLANVMYSHPLEAVQAISMLNNRTYYGQNLKIVMNKSLDYNKLLPKGLVSLGPGLGKYGTPIRDVIRQYEMCLNRKESLIDTKLFIWDKSTDASLTNVKSNSSSPHTGDDNTKEENDRHSASSRRSSLTESNIEEIKSIDTEKDILYSQFDRPIPNTSIERPEHFSTISLGLKLNGNQRDVETSDKRTDSSELNIVQNRFTNYMSNLGSNLQAPNFITQNKQSVGASQKAAGVAQIMSTMTRPGGYGSNFTSSLQCVQGPRTGFVHGHSAQRFPGPVARPNPCTLAPLNIRNVMPRALTRFPNPMVPAAPSSGPVRGPPMNTQNMPGPNRFMQQHVGGCPSVTIFRGINSVSLQVANIPPSLNLVGLCDKLSKFGQVTALEMVNQRLANVKFATPSEAERCFQQYRLVFQ